MRVRWVSLIVLLGLVLALAYVPQAGQVRAAGEQWLVKDRISTGCLSGQTGFEVEFRNLTPGEIVGQVMLARDALGELAAGRGTEICATQAAMDAHEEARVAEMGHTIWVTGCKSWYLDDRGVPAAWPWTFDRFREMMAAPLLDDFELEMSR